ncbi:MAG TPA: hypothetical protein VIJ88_01215 [Candidatus Paceibacterota bacterium]
MKKEASLYQCLHTLEPKAGLYQAVLERIAYAKRRSARVRAGFFSALAICSGAALVPAMQYAAGQFYASGFYDYLTLIFSDRSLVLTYWQQFSLSLVESLPSLALLLLLPIIFLLAYSMRRVVQTGRMAFASVQEASAY